MVVPGSISTLNDLHLKPKMITMAQESVIKKTTPNGSKVGARIFMRSGATHDSANL
jgi:hypothetical protein